MASANVELVRAMFASWESGNWSSAGWAHPEIELVIADGPSPETWRGAAGMASGWRDFLSVWEGYRVEAQEYRELDDNRVLVFARRIGRGKRSGVDIEQIGANGAVLLHIRHGAVTRVVGWFYRENALADLGLAQEAGPGALVAGATPRPGILGGRCRGRTWR
jgi:hypothetical protein